VRRAVLAAAAALLAAGCGRNPLFLRLGADYYPVTTLGSQWVYTVEQGGTQITTVLDQTVIEGRSCYRLQTGAEYSCWISGEGLLEHFEDHRVVFNGYEVPVYQAWVTWLDWPLAAGSSRSDSASTYTVFQGVTISHDWRRTTVVEGVGSWGQWQDCYVISQEERFIDWVQTGGFEPETVTVSRTIWLAPDVGMVRKETPDSTLTLSTYTPGG
jgi:hypothetical protein